MTTNYTNTFISVASDCPAGEAQVPPARVSGPTVAQLQYELLAADPYTLTSDDLLFEVHAIRNGVSDETVDDERDAFLAKDLACLRSSPLAKRYGWGIHHDAHSRVAVVPLGSDRYRTLSEDEALTQREAMRSRRT